jgi:Tol biopolymer transport system component
LCSYDNSGYKQLTRSTDLVRPGFVEDDATQLEASWSGDSRKLAFLVWERASPGVYSSGDIYVADLETHAVKRIAEGAFAELRGPMIWSPDGTRIAVRTSPRLNIEDQLLVLDVATGVGRSVTAGLPAGGVEQYAWAPDSSAIAFTWNDGSVRLYVATAAGQTARDLGPAWGGTPPAWSADGRWIAATQVLDVFSSVFVVKADGSERRDLAGRFRQSDHATWAPDSERLAFEGSPSGEFNDRHLFVTDNTGGTPREIAKETTLAFSPLITFSKDAQRLLFTADAAGCFEGCPPGYLFMIDVDGGSPPVRLHEQPVYQFLGWLP